jgi:hypothetical protein
MVHGHGLGGMARATVANVSSKAAVPRGLTPL